jgi:VirB8 protein
MPNPVPPPVQSNSSSQIPERVARIEQFLKAGREDAFVKAWGRLHAYTAQQRWILVLSVALNLVFAVCVVWLALAYQRRAPWVFVKDNLGNVVQVDPRTLNAADTRDEAELKAFSARWVRDAFEFTPLDVRDRRDFALRFVEPRAHGEALLAMRANERAEQVASGLSVKIQEDIDKGQLMQVQIMRFDPLETLVLTPRISISPSGETRALPALAVRLRLRQVPRSPANGHGLIISDVSAGQN